MESLNEMDVRSPWKILWISTRQRMDSKGWQEGLEKESAKSWVRSGRRIPRG
jgi:hypothetical protein